jgi:hypothetical protein
VIACPIGSPAATAAAFAPSGARIAYARATATGFEIDEAGLDGRTVGVVLRGSGGSPTVLRWSPRDKRLAYVRGGELHVADAGVDHLLYTTPAPLELGGWTANAGALVVSAGGESFVVDAVSGVARDLGRGQHAVPSPDGTRVALAVPLGVPPMSYAEELDVISLADGTRRMIFHSENGLPSLAWSPDSRQVAFLWNNDVEPSLMAQNADGSSTGLFGREHGALPTQVGMAGQIYWGKRGMVGFTRGEEASASIGFYNVLTGKDIYDWAPTQSVADVSGSGTAAYLNHDGLRLAAWGGAGDRTLFPCRGTAGADRIVARAARTTILAGAGNDVIDARNYRIDTIDCGPGRDVVYADKRDRVRRCERVIRRH